ncbi:hypothetical protein Hanom_Chr16g01511891 [Helianthus anomalus]
MRQTSLDSNQVSQLFLRHTFFLIRVASRALFFLINLVNYNFFHEKSTSNQDYDPIWQFYKTADKLDTASHLYKVDDVASHQLGL